MNKKEKLLEKAIDDIKKVIFSNTLEEFQVEDIKDILKNLNSQLEIKKTYNFFIIS